jgi:hypothetical protein
VPTPAPGQGESARPVANSEALPIGTPVIDAQLLGLGALGVAFLLAVTRLSIRRRPAAATAGGRGAAVAASTASASTARPSAEPAQAEVATGNESIPDNADVTATADEAPAGEAVRAIPAADDLAGGLDDTEIIETIPAATTNPSETSGEPETDDGE